MNNLTKDNSEGNIMKFDRSDIWLINLGEVDEKSGSIQKGICRPCVIISGNKANSESPVIHIAPLTSKLNKNPLPTHVNIGIECGLRMESIVLVEQNMLINKSNLIKKVGRCDNKTMNKIDIAILIQFGLLDKVKSAISNKINKLQNKRTVCACA